MLRLLPYILIPILILGGLGYWRFVVSKPSLPSAKPTVTSQPQNTSEDQLELPATSSDATLEDRIKILENLAKKLVAQVNSLKASSASSAVDSLSASVTELKARVSALEKNPTSGSSGQSAVYIPLGSGGGPWNNQDWYSLNEYQVALDPANYPGYSGMSLEGVFRLTSAVGTASLRLYNSTDGSAISPEISTTSTTSSLKTSASFKLPAGSKTYILQVKSSQNQDVLIQSARIKVSF